MGGNPRERGERGEREEEKRERFRNLKGGFRTRGGSFDIVVAAAAATTIDIMLPIKKQVKTRLHSSLSKS